jgi:ADP-ribose pyrophosphatase YjhB (NUDIX family)
MTSHKVITLSALPLSATGEPPRDFTLIPRGTLRTVYGDFEWDDESARLTAAAWARRNRRFLWDYEHLSGFTGTNGKPLASVHDRRSAGDAASPVAASDGFKLTDMRWTPDAERYIRNREYLYYSPVIAVDETSKPPRIVDVIKSSLTNDPATLGCAPLTLSADEMDELSLAPSIAAATATAATEELAAKPAGQERPTLCLDFDGVIHPNHPHDAQLAQEPIAGAKDGVASLRKLGPVVVQSVRATSPEGREAIAAYLRKHGIDVDGVSGEKPQAALYVDDRGLRFTGSWPALVARAQSGNFKTWEQEMSQQGQPQAQPAPQPAELAANKLAGPVSHNPDAYPKDDSMSWDGPEAEKHVWAWAGESADGTPNFIKARSLFGVVVGDGSKKGDYKLIHHDIKDGRPVTVRGGVRAAMNAIQGARGGVDMPADYESGVKAHLAAEAHRFGDKAPWESEQASQSELTAQAAPTEQTDTVTLSTAPASATTAAQGLTSPALQQGVRPLTGKQRKRPHGTRAKKQAVTILVENAQGHSLWARRLSSGKYSAPGGFVKKIDKATGQPERPVDAACRELREETGIEAKPSDMRYMGTLRGRHKSGKAIDVHGYRLTSDAEPQHLAKHEFSHPWERHAEHPIGEAHHSRDALSILSAKHADLRRETKSTQQTATVPLTANETAGSPGTANASSKMKIIGSTYTMDIQRARSLTSTLLGGLPSLSGDGIKAEVATAAQNALSAVKALDDALAAAGASESNEVEQALSLSALVMDVTGSKTMDGINGKLLALSDAAKVAPVVLNLSTEQACKLEIDRGIKLGSINPAEKGRYYDLISKKVLTLSDCQNRANGPKLYDVPNTAPAPVGANSTQVDLSKPAPATPLAATTIAGEAPKPAAVVELSSQHKQLISDIERNLPDGMKLDRDAVVKAITVSTVGAQPTRMHNPSQPA